MVPSIAEKLVPSSDKIYSRYWYCGLAGYHNIGQNEQTPITSPAPFQPADSSVPHADHLKPFHFTSCPLPAVSPLAI